MKTELKTPMDLSHYAYESAREEMGRVVGDHFTAHAHCRLRVSIWDAQLALEIMGKYLNCSIETVIYYPAYEWSLHFADYEVHSPGHETNIEWV